MNRAQSEDDTEGLLSQGKQIESRRSWSVARVAGVIAVLVSLLLLFLSQHSSAPEQVNLQGLQEQFQLLTTWQSLIHGDPFAYRCPLPVLQQMAVIGLEGKASLGDCCSTYNSLPSIWPYQFSECQHETCPSCWKLSGQSNMSRNPVRTVAALGYAAALAVSGPLEFEQKAPSVAPSVARRLQGMSGDITRHAGLDSKKILAPVKRGLRARDGNVCPKISDFEEYYLNDDKENVHARVYKSLSARVAVVSFRGTQPGSIKNWEIDSDILMTSIDLGPPGPHLPTAPSTAKVHEGFYLELQRVLPHVKKWVEGYIVGTHGLYGVPEDWKLVFTGHSLGAALATLAATLAEAQGWKRRPDAVVAFGSPRLGDAGLSEWWESKGLCDKLLRVAVYNDAVTWMPLMEPYQVMDVFQYCLENMASCFKQFTEGPKKLHPSKRWAHICPSSELVVPGAMKGVNGQMEDFSALGGVLAHFMGNSLFGYGHGVLNSDVVKYDEYCGMSPEVFPAAQCEAVEQLENAVCFGLDHDEEASTAEQCQLNCCQDPYCSVWQLMKGNQCWRGRSHDCSSTHPYALDVAAGARIH